MEKTLFEIAVDMSNSMSCVKKEVINGLNNLITTLKQSYPESIVSMIMFGNDNRVLAENKIARKLRPIKESDYTPMGRSCFCNGTLSALENAEKVVSSADSISKTLFIFITEDYNFEGEVKIRSPFSPIFLTNTQYRKYMKANTNSRAILFGAGANTLDLETRLKNCNWDRFDVELGKNEYFGEDADRLNIREAAICPYKFDKKGIETMFRALSNAIEVFCGGSDDILTSCNWRSELDNDRIRSAVIAENSLNAFMRRYYSERSRTRIEAAFDTKYPPLPIVTFDLKPCSDNEQDSRYFTYCYVDADLGAPLKYSVYDSKMYGMPYIPEKFKYPLCPDGTPIPFFAQFNFDKLPHIDCFPDKGILQFYVKDSKNFRVIYHEKVNYKNYMLLSDELLSLSPLNNTLLKTETLLIPKEATFCPLTISSNEAYLAACPFYNFEDQEDFIDAYDDLCEEYAQSGIRTNNETCMGGYPSSFKNRDIVRSELDDYMLFQTFIPPKNQGIHFFISPSDLINKRFDNVRMVLN